MPEKRIWDELPMETRTLLARVLANAYTGGAGNRVILVDADGSIVTSLGGGGAGGGESTYSTAMGDITVAINPGTKTFTITPARFPVTIAEEHILAANFCKVMDSSGNSEDCELKQISVTGITGGSLVTLAQQDANFATGDTIILKLEGPMKHDDASLDVKKVIDQAPLWAHYTDVDHIVDDSDATVDQHYSPEIFTAGYRNLVFQFTGTSDTNGVTFKIYGTLNPDAATPADLAAAPSADWVDFSTDIIGAASVELDSGASGVYIVDTPTMIFKYIVQYEPDHGTNETDIFVRKY